MRVRPVPIVPLLLLATASGLVAAACGGESSRTDRGGVPADAGGASMHPDAGDGPTSPDPGDACGEPPSAVPDPPPYEGPPTDGLESIQLTFHNRCAQTVWPAWNSAGGLDNSVIDKELWLPMSPGSDRTVTVRGGVYEIGFWGRTGCSFDQSGNGSCQTGDCGEFVCPTVVNGFPPSATVYSIEQGFLGGYNLPVRFDGATCGTHDCVADLTACAEAPILNACGTPIACSDICSDPTAVCCGPAAAGCAPGGWYRGPPLSDLELTFCP